MRKLDWYFDFISPYSYLQAELLHTLPPHVEVSFKPLLFAGLLKHWDNVGPAEIAPKRQWTFQNVAWLARRHGITLELPASHPFNPLPLLRLCVVLGPSHDVVLRLFRYVWREGHLPGEEGPWNALLAELGVTPEQLEDDAVKAALRANGEQAIAAKVFGVPSAVIDGRCFWGVESTDMLKAYLAGDDFFESAQLKAAQALLPGLVRAR